MIPKILHYIWLGGKKTELAEKCIASFHTFLPEYEIKEWNESNIDVNEFGETLKEQYQQWYAEKKYAFCSDIARLFILQKYGGIYVDTDVEFIRPIPKNILTTNFLCRDNPIGKVTCGDIWGVEPDEKLVRSSIRWFRQALKNFGDTYGDRWIFNELIRSFFNDRGYDRYDDVIQEISGYKIYSMEWFCPKNYKTQQIKITSNTISIHHYDGSWNKRMLKFKIKKGESK